MQQRGGIAGRVHRIEDGWHLLVLDLDQRNRFLRFARCARRHGRHSVTHMQHAVARHDRLVLDHRSVEGFQVGHIVSSQRHHVLRYFGGIDRQHLCVRVRGAKNAGMQHAFDLLVLSVLEAAGDPRV